ncbi:MAG: DUF1918 domain-containing protein [Actinobacteria bacterium ATB1]|nr:DUF1918 domain-containing protein [Actinobacteria bacterium ATB1]
MKAKPGDRLVIHGHRVGTPVREARVLEVRGTAGEPPYIVHWLDNDQESLFFPGPDASIESKRSR